MTTAALGELAEFVNGAAFKPEDWHEEGLPIIRIQNLTDPSKPFNRTRREVPDKLHVRPGDLLVSWSATLGVFEWPACAEEAVVNQHIFRVLPRTGRVDKRYLMRALDRALSTMGRHLHGATMKHVKRAEFLCTEIPLPPIDEQRRIAAVLDHADELRRKRQTCLALIESLKESIFLDMFGDPIANPLEWPADENLGDFADITSGITKGRRLTSAEMRSVPYLAVANVQHGHLRLEAVKTIEATPEEIARYRLVSGDLVLTEGGDPDKLGRGTVWSGEIEECIHQNHIFRVRIVDPGLEPIFVSTLLASSRGRRYFRAAAKQTTGIASINKSQLRSFPMLKPPTELQREFVEQLRQRANLNLAVERHAAALGALFDSLQYQAFEGQL